MYFLPCVNWMDKIARSVYRTPDQWNRRCPNMEETGVYIFETRDGWTMGTMWRILTHFLFLFLFLSVIDIDGRVLISRNTTFVGWDSTVIWDVKHGWENEDLFYNGLEETCRPGIFYFPLFHFSLYQDGTKWVCTARDVPGTKTSGRNGKKWKVENSGATRFLQPTVPHLFFSFLIFFLFSCSIITTSSYRKGKSEVWE